MSGVDFLETLLDGAEVEWKPLGEVADYSNTRIGADLVDQPQFNANVLKEVKMPIPYPSDPEKSLTEQKRIVAILDKFDALTNSITEGLPREIELRQKQYTHYRDLLLSFPKSQEVVA